VAGAFRWRAIEHHCLVTGQGHLPNSFALLGVYEMSFVHSDRCRDRPRPRIEFRTPFVRVPIFAL
jgi:hypothetical protein